MAFTVALVLAIVGAVAQALVQASHQLPEFTYLGCFTVDLASFTNPMVFSDGVLTPEACQRACHAYQLAAVFQDCCRCGNDATALVQLDEAICDHSCMGDPALGACGSTCAQDTASTGNVYGNNRPLPQAQDPATIRTGNPLNPSPSISTTCTEEPVLSTSPPTVTRSRQEQEPVTIRMTNTGAPTQAADTTCDENKTLSTDPPDVTLISPVGVAPDAPTTVPAGLSLQPPPALSSSPPPSQGPAGPTTPPLDDYGRTDVPTSVTKVPQGGPTQASEESEPPTYGEPSLSGLGPDPSSGPSPPEYSPAEQPTPSADIFPDPNAPEQGYNEPPSSTNCSTSFAPDVVPSETTLWPKPSDPNDPQGQPPVPSQVPGSYTTRTHVPPFTTVGGLAVLAAMIM